ARVRAGRDHRDGVAGRAAALRSSTALVLLRQRGRAHRARRGRRDAGPGGAVRDHVTRPRPGARAPAGPVRLVPAPPSAVGPLDGRRRRRAARPAHAHVDRRGRRARGRVPAAAGAVRRGDRESAGPLDGCLGAPARHEGV
ncbi:MAG: hypothetical protein AVDCRST_MAG57-2469, partial [uncultured Blastococcus sp.]